MDRREFVKVNVLGGVECCWRECRAGRHRFGQALTAGRSTNTSAAWAASGSTRGYLGYFKSGRPESLSKELRSPGYYFDALRQAVAKGCNLFVTHEPTYYNHTDTDPSVFAFEIAKRKRAFIEESGLTIIPCHDVWDRVPEIGIPDAWGKRLGWTKVVRQQTFYRVYELPPTNSRGIGQTLADQLLRSPEWRATDARHKTIRTSRSAPAQSPRFGRCSPT